MAGGIEVIDNVATVTPQEEHANVNVENVTVYREGGETVTGTAARIRYITVLASAWVECDEACKYSQVVNVEGVTANDQVNINIDGNQALIFREKDVGFYAENENGVVTVFAIGQKPENDYTFQVTIVEEEHE